MVLGRAVKEALAVNTGSAENGFPSNDRFVGDLDEKAGCSSSAKTTVSRDCAETGDGNAFRNAVLHRVPVEWNVKK